MRPVFLCRMYKSVLLGRSVSSAEEVQEVVEWLSSCMGLEGVILNVTESMGLSRSGLRTGAEGISPKYLFVACSNVCHTSTREWPLIMTTSSGRSLTLSRP